MSTDQRTSYTLVEAVKKGMQPKEMQEILCGPLCHVRFVTNATAQCNNYHIMERTHISRHPRHCVTQTGGWQLLRELSTCGQGSTDNLRVLESLAKFCLQSWQVWGSWGANQRRWEMSSHSTWEHPEWLILSLLASPIISERKFAISQVLMLRGGREFSDYSFRPRITPKLNLSATYLPTLTLKLVTESAAAVCGQEGRDGFIRANDIGKRCCSLRQKHTSWLHILRWFIWWNKWLSIVKTNEKSQFWLICEQSKPKYCKLVTNCCENNCTRMIFYKMQNLQRKEALNQKVEENKPVLELKNTGKKVCQNIWKELFWFYPPCQCALIYIYTWGEEQLSTHMRLLHRCFIAFI